MSPVSLASLTLADLEGTVALDSIRIAATLRGVPAETILAEVTAEPLSIHELTVGLQTRAGEIVDEVYESRLQPGLFAFGAEA